MDSPDQIKATKNPINKKDNKYFEYSITVTLNHEEILKEKQKLNFLQINITGKEQTIHQKKDDWKKIEKNYLTIAVIVLYAKSEKIYPAYNSKHNADHEKNHSFNDSKRR